MKTEIIPTILVKSFKEVEERIKAVENYVNWVQIDVMDGIFVYNETWPHSVVPGPAKRGKAYSKEIEKLKNLKTKVHPVKSREAGTAKQLFNGVKFEVHLMVEKPEEEVDDWLKIVDRVIIHFESKITNREYGIEELIKKVHKNKKEIGLALNPETHYAVATPFLPRHGKRRGEKDLDLVQIMTVQPGWGGQQFRDWILAKIEFLRKIWPKGNIEVDGGVNDENIGRLHKAGANLFDVGTYIYKSKNIEKAIKNLKELMELI